MSHALRCLSVYHDTRQPVQRLRGSNWHPDLLWCVVSGRVLRRPLFGWGFRLWWQGVCEGLGLAVLVLGSWGGLNLFVAALRAIG